MRDFVRGPHLRRSGDFHIAGVQRDVGTGNAVGGHERETFAPWRFAVLLTRTVARTADSGRCFSVDAAQPIDADRHARVPEHSAREQE